MQNSSSASSSRLSFFNLLVQRIVGFAIKHSLFIILLVILITITATFFCFRVGVKASVDELLPQDSEIVSLTEEHGQTRMDRDWLVLLVEGEDVYNPDSLIKLEKVIESIESRNEVTGVVSPFKFITFSGKNGPLRLEYVAPDGRAPQSITGASEFRNRLIRDQQAVNLVVSEDGNSLGVIFNVPLRNDYSELTLALEEEIQPLRDLGLKVWLAGMPTIDAATREHLTADLPILFVLSVLIIMITYYASFRSVVAAFLPVIVVAVATIWAIGTMSILNIDFTIVSVTTPLFIMTLGSSYSVHVLSAHFRTENTSRNDSDGIISNLVGVVATITLAALTTMAGFTSLATASVQAVREFGLVTGLGIAYCAVLALFFLPACLKFVAIRPNSTVKQQRMKVMYDLGIWVLRHRLAIIIIVPVALIGLVLATLQLRYETDFTRFFRGKDTVMDSNLHVQRRLGGFIDFNITITAPEDENGAVKPGYFLDPVPLNKIAEFEGLIREMQGVSWSYSFVSELQRMNLALTGDASVPKQRAAVLLLSRVYNALRDSGQPLGPNPLDLDGSRLHITTRVFDVQQDTFFLEGRFRDFLAKVEKIAQENLADEMKVLIWSSSIAALRFTEVLFRDHMISIIVSLVLVFIVTTIGFRSIFLGGMCLLPMMIGILVIFAYLALSGVTLDALTMMFSSVAVGAGVDYAVHVIVGFNQRVRRIEGGVKGAIVATMVTSGRAIVINTVSLSLGMLVLSISGFLPLAKLGLLLAATIVAAAIGSLVVLPALLSYRRSNTLS